MTNTVMSKRKLTLIVDEGIVDGWDDPRMPTVRGIMRRGLTVEGLKQFILAQGGSRSIVLMEWDKIWAFNKKVIDPIAPRYTALDATQDLVKVTIKGTVNEEKSKVQLHPKDPTIGEKYVWYSSEIYLEHADAAEMKKGDIVTFVNWGNLKIVDVKKKGDVVVEVVAELDLDNKDYKKTLKVTWLAEAKMGKNIPIKAAYYDHVISKAIIKQDEDWKQYINKDSVVSEKLNFRTQKLA